MHTGAGSFSLEKSTITGEDDSAEGNRGISSNADDEDIIVDNVDFIGLRVGIYNRGNSKLSVNGSTFDSNYRAMTIESEVVPTLTNNVFADNNGDISAAYDSEIRAEIAEEVENADNNNTLDRKSTRLNSSHVATAYAVFCL